MYGSVLRVGLQPLHPVHRLGLVNASNGETFEIAAALSISIHTVSRHRQDILAHLNAKNSLEACRTAQNADII